MATVDASQVFSGIDVSTTLGAIVAAGCIVMTMNFARWAMYVLADIFEEIAIWRENRRNGDY